MIVRPVLCAGWGGAGLPGCWGAPGPGRWGADAAACRAEVDRVYSAQNRGDLTFRDQRDTPFNSSYFPGDTPRGLASEYGRDNQYSSCIANSSGGGTNAPPAPGGNIGPVFSPAVR